MILEVEAPGDRRRYLRLVAGRGVMLQVPAGTAGEARVLWLRYLGRAPHVADKPARR